MNMKFYLNTNANRNFWTKMNIEISFFVSPGTKNLSKFSISADLLYQDPSTWKDNHGNKIGIEYSSCE